MPLPIANWKFARATAGEMRKHLFPACDLLDCPRRRRFLPAYFLRNSGTEFDDRWYCSSKCLERAVRLAVQNLISRFLFERPRTYRLPIGLLLVNRGQISYAQLQEALRMQRADGGSGKIGMWLRQMNATSDEHLVNALAQQWACPVYPLERHPNGATWNDVAPFTLFESVRAVPAHLSLDGKTLHVAFSERIDHTTLYALERILDCRTVACVASEAAVNAILEAQSTRAGRSEISFDSLRDAAGISSAICSYVQRIESPRLKLARAGAHLWARLYRGRESRDLLFRILPTSNPNLEQSAKFSKALTSTADISEEGVSDAALPL
jgi:hypothetical protein